MNTDNLLDAIGQIDDRFIQTTETEKERHPRVLRRIAMVAAAAVLCGLLGVSALAAANVGNAYDLLYSVSPAVAQSLKPVRTSCEDNGIIMEVEGASVEGSSATMLVLLHDVEEDRVDETTDLFDSYSIRRPFDSSATCEMVGYDEETKSAAFLITINRTDDREISSGKVTFGATRFLSDKRYTDMTRKITVPEGEPELMTDPQLRGGSGTEAEQTVLLKPVPGESFSPVEGVQITADAFAKGLPLPDEIARLILMVCLSVFAFTTILGWNYYSERCLSYLIGPGKIKTIIFRWVYIAAVFVGPYLTADAVWGIADIFNGLMALPNITALVMLSDDVRAETKSYFARINKSPGNETTST